MKKITIILLLMFVFVGVAKGAQDIGIADNRIEIETTYKLESYTPLRRLIIKDTATVKDIIMLLNECYIQINDDIPEEILNNPNFEIVEEK